MARNDGIDRTSVRNLAVSDKAVGNTQQHNEREKDSYRNPDIIPQRTAWNFHFKKPAASYTDLFAQMEANGTISTRGLKPDATHYCELIFDVNSAYFDNHGGYEFAKQFYADAYKAAVQIVGGEQYILSAVMHADEINRAMTEALGRQVYHYHLHVVYVPAVSYTHLDVYKRQGRPGIFWSVELGALASLGVLFWLFRDQRQPVHVTVETEVEDDVPTALLLLTVGLLIAASFLPEPSGGVLHLLYTLRSGLVCMGLCLFGAARACWRSRSLKPLAETFRALDYDTLLLLFSLFILLEGVSRAGVIDAAAQLFHSAAGDEPLHLYLLLVAASVGLSAFIDNIPYVAAMLPVVQGVAALMNGGAGIEPELFYFGLLTGATLGGNLTPIGASANIAAIGILRKNGETVRTRDFLRIGVPFTLAAVLVGAGSLWLFWGI